MNYKQKIKLNINEAINKHTVVNKKKKKKKTEKKKFLSLALTF